MTVKVTIPSESAEQIAFVGWFKREYPETRILAIPNGGYRAKATAERLKAEGVSPGVPDLFIPAIKTFIEMKRVKGGRLSVQQKDWINHLEGAGFTVLVAMGAQHAIDLIIPLMEQSHNG